MVDEYMGAKHIGVFLNEDNAENSIKGVDN